MCKKGHYRAYKLGVIERKLLFLVLYFQQNESIDLTSGLCMKRTIVRKDSVYIKEETVIKVELLLNQSYFFCMLPILKQLNVS